MTKLTKIRIALTLGAIVGIAPVTLIFIWGLIYLVIAIVYTDKIALPVTIIAISVPSLWGAGNPMQPQWRASPGTHVTGELSRQSLSPLSGPSHAARQ
ncbi:hypothetical protein NWF32_21105 [Pseudomonas qingdaonensis]|nr:hypothetical protein [Pseudomonas qingdaonensis]